MVVTIGEDGLPVDKNEEDDADAPDQAEQGEGHESGLAEPRADLDEGMDPDAGSDADDAAAEGEGRSSQQDIHASTTNISQPGDPGDDEEGEGGLTAADSSGNLIVKKKRAVSKSPRKGKRKGPGDSVDLIEFGPSKKLGGKLVVTEKIAIPQEIADHVAATYEDGFDALTPELARDLVHRLYVLPQRKRLAGQWEFEKSRPDLSSWQRLLIHLAYNIQPGKGSNEDIEEIKEEAENASDDEQNDGKSSALRNTDGVHSGLNKNDEKSIITTDPVTQPLMASPLPDHIAEADKQSEQRSSEQSEKSKRSAKSQRTQTSFQTQKSRCTRHSKQSGTV